MTDPKTRALALCDELLPLIPGWLDLDALRLAITQIPTTTWQPPMETAPELFKRVRVLVECDDQRWTDDAQLDTDSWHLLGPTWTDMDSRHVQEPWRVIAWRPADSTDLPEEWRIP